MFTTTIEFLAKRVIAGYVDLDSIGHNFNLHNLVAEKVEEVNNPPLSLWIDLKWGLAKAYID